MYISLKKKTTNEACEHNFSRSSGRFEMQTNNIECNARVDVAVKVFTLKYIYPLI